MEQAADTGLDYTVHRAGGVSGVVAMVTDRRGNVYEGAAGVREPGKDQAMTADSVMAIFSTTKAITRVTVMQLVEEGRISLANAAGFDVEDVEGVEDLRIAVDEACTLLLSDGSVDEQRIVDAPAGGGVAITVEPSPPQRLDGRPVEKLTHEILSAVVDECATETPDDARPLTSTA